MASEVQRRFWRIRARKRYWADPERKREAVRQWRKANPKRAAEVKRAYRKRVRERQRVEAAPNCAADVRP